MATHITTSDHLLDRRKLRRKLSFWRFLGLIGLGLVLFALASNFLGMGLFNKFATPHIAKIELNGVITGSIGRLKLLDDLAGDSKVAAVIININSPGGTTAGGEAIYNSIRSLSERKPVVATIDGMGTSAAYMAAIATDQVFARRSSITGSIGVIYQSPNVTALLDKLGIKFETIKSSPLKAAPSPFEQSDPRAVAVIQTLIDDTYKWFLDLVIDRRGFSLELAQELGDGRVYSGDRALKLDLIDQIGDQRTARDWLISEKNVPKVLPILDRQIKVQTSLTQLTGEAMASAIGNLLGLNSQVHSFIKTPINGTGHASSLDGLISVWHPSL